MPRKRMTLREQAERMVQKLTMKAVEEHVSGKTEHERKRDARFDPRIDYPTRIGAKSLTLKSGELLEWPGRMTCHTENGHLISCGQLANTKRNTGQCPCWCHTRIPYLPHTDTWTAPVA